LAIGFDVYDDTRKFESKAVSKHVSMHMEYPCLVVKNTAEHPIRKYMLEVHKVMNSRPIGFDEASSGLLIHLYINQDSKLLKFGTIQPAQVKSFLRLFDGVETKGYYDETTLLEGDMLYALAE